MTDPATPVKAKSGNTIGSAIVVILFVGAISMKIIGASKSSSNTEPPPPPVVAVDPVAVDGGEAYGLRPNPAIPKWSDPPPVRQDPQVTDQSLAAMQLLLEAAARQQQPQPSQEYQRFNQAVQQASVCNTCGGAGTYRFVDQFGNLIARQCQKCMGSGRSW